MVKNKYKNLAYEQLGHLLGEVDVKSTLLDTLTAYQWTRLEGESFSNKDFNQMNLSFDTRSCLPRALFAVMIGEKYFPKTKVQVAEVLEDLFRNYLLKMAEAIPSKWGDETFISELLMYEEPHFVVVVDGTQFEALTVPYAHLPNSHPKINILDDTWTALAAAHTVSEALAFQMNNQNDQFIKKLMEAKELCKNLLLVDENLIPVMYGNNDLKETKKLLDKLFLKRGDARFLWAAYAITEEEKYMVEFKKVYPDEVFNYINKEAYGL